MAPPSSAKTLALACLLSSPAWALEALDDEGLGAVQGQSGLQLQLDNTGGVNLGRLEWLTDSGVTDRQAQTIIDARLDGLAGNPWQFSSQLDVGSDSSNPALRLHSQWQPQQLTISRLTLNTPAANLSTNSLGQLAVQSQGHLTLNQVGGLLNAGGNNAQLDFASQGEVIYRQGAAGSPELSLGGFVFKNCFSNGPGSNCSGSLGYGLLGVNSEGLLVQADHTYTDLLFDVMYKATPTNFDSTGRSGIIQFGWTGSLLNPKVALRPGGVAYGTHSSTLNHPSGASYGFFDHTGLGTPTGARSQGLNLQASWDYDSDFAFILGQAGGNRSQARFMNWRRMAGLNAAIPMLSMPITLDVLQNGQGPGGLCFGGGFSAGSPTPFSCTSAGGQWRASAVAASQAAFAALIRDGHLHGYSQQIQVVDPTSSNPLSTYDWGLMFTFGKLDADILLQPQGPSGGLTGLKSNITLTAQSPGFWDQATSSNATTRGCLFSAAGGSCTTAGAGTRWATNTHFLVADTNVGGTGQQYGVGLLNADLLWSVRDMYFRVVDSDATYTLMPGGLWLHTENNATYQFRGLFGGGNLLDLSSPTGISLMDVKLSANRFLFALSPQTPVSGDAPVGFNAFMDLDGTSYLSLAEVGSPQSAYRIYDMSGRIAWRNGQVNLVSGQNTADGLPQLAIRNELLFGSSANFGNGGGNPLLAKTGFGSENFGRIALPAGAWHSDISLKIPTN